MSTLRGFVALISAIIIAAILLIVVIAGGLAGIYTRYDILDSELKGRSAALVDACADTVAARLLADSSYTGPETVTVGGSQCSILSSTASGGNRIYKLQAIYQHSYTNTLVTFDTSSATVVSWQEVGSF
jgi:hypothetical protein